MDKKAMYAIIVVAILVVAGMAAVIAMNNGEKEQSSKNYINVVGRINTDGSGIYLKEGEKASDYIETVDVKPTSGEKYIEVGDKFIVFKAENWGGKLFGTPGTSTIQHVQLQTLVENVMGLKFKAYAIGSSMSKDTVYFDAVKSFAAYKEKTTGAQPLPITGAIIWEAQYSLALENKCVGLEITNNIFPGHTCCVIAGNTSFMESNSDSTVKFLVAYLEILDKMVKAIEDPTSEDYKKLVEVATNKVSMPSGTSTETKIKVIENALNIVKFGAHDENANDPLVDLRKDIATLAVDLKKLGSIKKSYSDLGFESADDFAKKFVDGTYMKKAMEKDYKDDGSKVKIKLSVIAGDMHQIAIHYGVDIGIFDKYGIDIVISSQDNGPAVATALQAGEADLGLLGAPPITITVMNSSLVTA
ncbi:MAG: hypothetical protein KIG18_03615 [Candidatus Methanomethylophilaceae archaeon]|nr:hypothetical protein [Candidatus Methanomethylophilaceae archaeon]